MGPMQWDGGNDPLESPYRSKELIYTGLANAKAKTALESQMHAAALGTNESQRQAMRDNLDLSQTQAEANNWAAGRDIQHDRNLQNAEQQRRQYDSETARYVSDNQLRGQQALSSGLNLGAGLFMPPGQGAQGTPGTTLLGPGGQTIGGSGMTNQGGALSALNRPVQPPPPPPMWRR